MRSNVLTIAKKELARFFSNKASAFVSIALPGLSGGRTCVSDRTVYILHCAGNRVADRLI